MTDPGRLALLAGAPCTVDPGSFSSGPRPPLPLSLPLMCAQPAVALVTVACPHEHVDRALTCAACTARLQDPASALICPHCADHPELPHDCPGTVRAEQLPAEPGPFGGLARGGAHYAALTAARRRAWLRAWHGEGPLS